MKYKLNHDTGNSDKKETATQGIFALYFVTEYPVNL
jgi:hypothetical protein